MAKTYASLTLAERPVGDIIPGKTFERKTTPIPVESDLKNGQILVETLYISLDPAMRGWLRDSRSYIKPVQIGDIMRSANICRVVASKSGQVRSGDIVVAGAGWTEYAILDEGSFEAPSSLPNTSHPTDYLSALGMTALTAYFGMNRIGQPKPGELVVVSGAAGATGSIAGQIAKIYGAKVLGIAGSDDKCAWLKEIGFDDALNYKDPDFKSKFKDATKDLIDVFWDNVGGDILDLALSRAKAHARFVMCGGISQYNAATPQGPKNINMVIAMRIRMEGFIVFDYIKEYPEARRILAKWVNEGKIKRHETIIKGGLSNIEEALVGLFKGINTGKLLVEVKSPKDESRL